MTAAAQKFMPRLEPVPAAARFLAHAPTGAAPAWVAALRATAAESFSASGLPHRGMEAWKHVNLRALERSDYRFGAPAPAVTRGDLPQALPETDGRVVLVNGVLRPDLSDLPRGVKIQDVMQAAARPEIEEALANPGGFAEDPLKALNAAHLRDGAVIEAQGEAGCIEVLLFSKAGAVAPAIYPRLLYRLAPGAGLSVIERHMGEGAYLSAPVTTIVLGGRARMSFCRLMEESLAAQHYSATEVVQEESSSFEGFNLASGASVGREAWDAILTGATTFTSISGLYMIKDTQNHAFAVSVTHCEPGGESIQFFKGVADDEARAVFQGSVHVRRGAQKTNGSQSHHALLLSPRAEARFQPGLDIRADDVKCGHGATLGQIDPVALFYLRSRGVPEAEARALLIDSFLSDAADKAGAQSALVHDLVKSWLSQRGAA